MTALIAQEELVSPKLVKVTTAAVLAALILHYEKPPTPKEAERGIVRPRSGEILITEPESPAGGRRCDLVRIGTWASRGVGIDAHEIKVSRGDWLKELDDPAKAEAWWPCCNRFWIVAPPGVVQPGELPKGWGLLELPRQGRRFKPVAPAAWKKPKLTAGLMVELIRRADNQRLAEMDALRSAHRDEIYRVRQERAERHAEAQIPWETRKRLELLAKVEAALGMPLDRFKGWPALPPSKITVEELAVLFGDVAAHVTALRRLEEADRAELSLLTAARATVKALERSL